MTASSDLDRAYALETPQDSLKLYADWAKTYDADFVDASGYVLHLNVAKAFAAAGGKGPVLDIGAGTGICGAALEQLGDWDVHGTDISPEMLRVAEQKGVYSNTIAGNVLETLPLAPGSYRGIVSAGTFTLGHVGPEGLNEVLRLLKSGGLAVISVRDLHFETAGFASKLAELEPALSDMSLISCPIYTDQTDITHADDKAFLLHLTKA